MNVQSKQSHITVMDVVPNLPEGPVHYSAIDLHAILSARLDAIQDELVAMGCAIPADRVFLIEALGGVVDLETGMVTHALL